jgi:hypothetical protein
VKSLKTFLILAIFSASTIALAEPKQAIICKKSESFDEAIAEINGMMIEPTWPMTVSYIRDTAAKTKSTISLNPKNFNFNAAKIQFFETKEKITEKKKTREATIYNACVPIEFN